MEHAKTTGIIHQTGGGTGMSYELLRPAGAIVNSTRGDASGPVSFMSVVNGCGQTRRTWPSLRLLAGAEVYSGC